jgi:hypothetical protein
MAVQPSAFISRGERTRLACPVVCLAQQIPFALQPLAFSLQQSRLGAPAGSKLQSEARPVASKPGEDGFSGAIPEPFQNHEHA